MSQPTPPPPPPPPSDPPSPPSNTSLADNHHECLQFRFQWAIPHPDPSQGEGRILVSIPSRNNEPLNWCSGASTQRNASTSNDEDRGGRRGRS